jgi:hypothetical protein
VVLHWQDRAKASAPPLALKGTATELLEKLKGQLPDAKKKPEDFPSNARALSGALKRIAPNLRRLGIDITWHRQPDKTRARILTIKPKSDHEKRGTSASAASAASEKAPPEGSASDNSDGSDTNPTTLEEEGFEL